MTVSVAISILGIFLGLFVIGFGAFRRWGALPLSLAATAIVALTSRLDLWQAFSETYIGGYTNTFATYFLIFLTTCLYSKLMTESGCAMSLALKLRDIFGKERVMTACCVAAAILTYAGISAFVLSYVMVPIMWTLFKDADIPRKLTICPIMFGCSTFVLGCTPLQSFFKVELPFIMPSVWTAMIMAFTLSFDDFVISNFTSGSSYETLTIHIYSMIKKSVKPNIYSLSTIVFFAVLVLLIVYNFTDSADDRRERAIERANLRRERRLRKERGELVEE